MNFRKLALSILLPALLLPYAASQTAAPTLAASAPTAVPPLVPYSGQVEGRNGQTSATFLIYKDQTGGEPLFTESQMVSLDPTGHYDVQLGAANPNGLPSDLFSSGEARWLEVQIAGQPPEPRVLLASVPYALKAADAATLGGLPASAFALAGSNIAIVNATQAAISPNAAASVTTTGGTANKVAKFSGANTIVNSILYDNGTEVGIGTTSPTATLTIDGTMAVNGTTTFKGSAVLGATGTATSSHSYNSQLLKAYTSAYNSSTKAVVQPRFEWQAEPANNNTAAPTGTLNLLSSTTTANATETAFYFNADGTIHFAPGQVLAAQSPEGEAVEGISGSAAGVYGTSTLGAGVLERSSSTLEGAAGVNGINDSAAGVGVFGSGSNLSATAILYNRDSFGAGLWGDSAIPAATAVHPAMIATADDQYAGFFANASLNGTTLEIGNYVNNGAALAVIMGGYFGNCYVDSSGDLSCNGTKSAVVPVDNNTRKVALYAVESPENWFEDFGSGQLSNGVATIALPFRNTTWPKCYLAGNCDRTDTIVYCDITSPPTSCASGRNMAG